MFLVLLRITSISRIGDPILTPIYIQQLMYPLVSKHGWKSSVYRLYTIWLFNIAIEHPL